VTTVDRWTKGFWGTVTGTCLSKWVACPMKMGLDEKKGSTEPMTTREPQFSYTVPTLQNKGCDET
jgi:hypothetical protein